jgi:hypothetical protein
MLDRAPAVHAKTVGALAVSVFSSARYAVCTGGRVPPE